jgi:hypothetical protein
MRSGGAPSGSRLSRSAKRTLALTAHSPRLTAEPRADTVQDLHGRRLLVAVSRRRRDCVSEYPPRAPRAGGGDSLRCRSSRPGHDGIAGSRHQSKADLCRRDTVRMSLAQLFAFIRCRWGPSPMRPTGGSPEPTGESRPESPRRGPVGPVGGRHRLPSDKLALPAEHGLGRHQEGPPGLPLQVAARRGEEEPIAPTKPLTGSSRGVAHASRLSPYDCCPSRSSGRRTDSGAGCGSRVYGYPGPDRA